MLRSNDFNVSSCSVANRSILNIAAQFYHTDAEEHLAPAKSSTWFTSFESDFVGDCECCLLVHSLIADQEH